MSANRQRLWFALFVLVVFGVGMAAGVLIDRRLATPDRLAFDSRPGPGLGALAGRRGVPPRQLLLERMTRDLDLTDAQQARVEDIFRERRRQLDDLQADVRLRFQREQQALHDQIRAVLTPEQQTRFDRWVDAEARGAGRRGRGPRPPE